MKNIQIALCTNQSEMILKLKILLIRKLIYVIVDNQSGQEFLTFETTCDFLFHSILSFAWLNIICTIVCYVCFQ